MHKYGHARAIICLRKQRSVCVFRPAQRGTATHHPSTTTTSPNPAARRSMKSSVTASQTEGPCRKETSSTVGASQFSSDGPQQAELWSSSQTRKGVRFWNLKVKSLEVSCCSTRIFLLARAGEGFVFPWRVVVAAFWSAVGRSLANFSRFLWMCLLWRPPLPSERLIERFLPTYLWLCVPTRRIISLTFPGAALPVGICIFPL